MVIDGESPTIVTGGGNNGNGFGFGDGWIALIFLAMLLNNGNGLFGGGNGSGLVAGNNVLASDFATLQRQLDSATNSIERKGDYIQEQICNSDQMNASLFANVNQTLSNGFANVNQGISSNRYENALGLANLGSTFQSCCCDQRVQSLENTNAIQSSLAGINYNLAQSTCGITNSINNTTRDIIDNANANFNALRAEIINDRLEEKNEKIQEQQQMINALQLRASQEAQNNYLVNALRPTPVPAFPASAMYGYYNGNGCGCNGTAF